MSIRIVRLGQPRADGEGLRLGTARYPPRGVAKDQLAERDYYDVWLPALAPSRELIRNFKDETGKDLGDGEAAWRRFNRSYLKEMKETDRRQLIELLATLSHTTSLAVGCYCEDENRCHRSLLRELLSEQGADLE